MPQPFRRILLMFIIGAASAALSAPAIGTAAAAQTPDASAQILAVMDAQAAAWNRGDVETFMTSYWKSDQTLFIGANGLARGYDAVLARYRKNYPDQKAMGHVSFSDLEVHITCGDAAFVVGQFHLVREKDSPSGIFSLDFRKFPEGWKIVLDHTTAFAAPASAPKPQ
jgi:ketosteroid isomerase-like protein